jgi:4-diphosphocytidyl-2-C-methyl-D-erythritol kinase
MPMREIAYAKLNLALHVRAREADGYHRIETIFAFCEDGDVVSAEAAESLSL